MNTVKNEDKFERWLVHSIVVIITLLLSFKAAEAYAFGYSVYAFTVAVIAAFSRYTSAKMATRCAFRVIDTSATMWIGGWVFAAVIERFFASFNDENHLVLGLGFGLLSSFVLAVRVHHILRQRAS